MFSPAELSAQFAVAPTFITRSPKSPFFSGCLQRPCVPEAEGHGKGHMEVGVLQVTARDVLFALSCQFIHF